MAIFKKTKKKIADYRLSFLLKKIF